MIGSIMRRIATVVALFAISLPSVSAAQALPADQLSSLSFRHIGVVGNRVASVAGVQGDPLTYYAGAASGGLWKTEDGGTLWEPLFDDQDVHSVGALAVSTSDTKIVWAGTGEPHIRSNVTIGNGVYKSTDGGDNWEHMGLDATGRISRIVIDPTNPDIVYVASLGARHLQNHGWWGVVGACALRRPEHRRVESDHGSEQPSDPIRRNVDRHREHLGSGERRAGLRDLHVSGWR
jgi:photosystem II stability/assembly factor-like uncharacterized protein